MELKVWVEGIQRIVCGVTENTTCQDVVFALAHATRRTGRFTLTERWRNNERFLAPYEHPLKVLFKWGEYSNDVQFILQHSSSNSNNQPLQSVTPPIASNTHSLRTPSPDSKETAVIRKSSTAPPTSLSTSVHSRADNVGIVKGIPKLIPPPSSSPPPAKAEERLAETHKSPIKVSDTDSSLQYRGSIYSQHNNGIRKTIPPSYRDPPEPSIPYIRALPPYRDPPPPTVQNAKNDEYRQDSELKESSARTVQYHDLLRLLAYQRDKLSSQQAELTKYDAEIMYWETKTKEQQHQMEILAKDATRVDATLKQVDEQLRSVGAIEEEMELVKQQDRTLKSELTLLRSKLANCETELLLCKNKIRLLLDEIRIEQRILAREADEKNHIERSTLAEVDRLQLQVEQAKYDTEMAAQIGDTLNKEVAVLEATINEKKRLVEKLVSDMKEANLESLAISPPEELKMIAEGAPFSKSGSTRRMIGSPRQLENAVPTSKNPHGVWV